MAHINTEEAVCRSLVDAHHGDEDAAIARSIVDEAARRHAAAKKPANAGTNEPHKPQRAQHNNTLASAQPTAAHTNTIQLVPRKTDEPSNASLMAGDEQWPADDDGDATMQTPTPTPPPTHIRPATPDVQTRPAKKNDATPPANQQQAPAHFNPSRRRRGRRVVTWFSGYGGFHESTILRRTTDWTVVGGTEDTRSDKSTKIAALWEDNNPHGKILGHHEEVQAKPLNGTLRLGEIDLHVTTYPCWDHADCNEEGKCDAGDVGSFVAQEVISKRQPTQCYRFKDQVMYPPGNLCQGISTQRTFAKNQGRILLCGLDTPMKTAVCEAHAARYNYSRQKAKLDFDDTADQCEVKVVSPAALKTRRAFTCSSCVPTCLLAQLNR